MNKQVIKDGYQDILAEDIWEIDTGDFNALQEKANLFLERVYFLSGIYGTIIKKTKLSDKIQDIYQMMKKEVQYTRDITALAHNFEISLNSFLGRTIYLTYVKQDGSLLFYGDAHIAELYKNVTRNKGRGNISKGKMFDANDLDENLKRAIANSQKKRYMVYQKAIERWGEKNKNELDKRYDPSKKTFYWRLMDNHHITGWTSPIATKGIIAEGYAGAVINEDVNITNSKIEIALQQLWLKHIQADSIGGLVKGDVVLKSNGDIQFAIKSGSFSTAMLGQYINLAENIKQLQHITLEELKNEQVLSKLIKKQNQLTDALVHAAYEEAQKELDETIDSTIPKT